MIKKINGYLAILFLGVSLTLAGCESTSVDNDATQTEKRIEKDAEKEAEDLKDGVKEKEDAAADDVKKDLDEKETALASKEALRELFVTVDESFKEGENLEAARLAAARMLICEGKYDALDKGIYFKELIDEDDFDGITGKGVALYKTGVMTKLAKYFGVTEEEIREAFIDPKNTTPNYDMDYYQYYMVNPDFNEEHVLDGIPEVFVESINDDGDIRTVTYMYDGKKREGSLKKNSSGDYVLVSVKDK